MHLRIDQAEQLMHSLVDRVDEIDERTQGLTPAQERSMQERVAEIVRLTKKASTPLPHDILWGRLKHRLRVGSYNEIPHTRFDEAMAFLDSELEKAHDPSQPQQGGLFQFKDEEH